MVCETRRKGRQIFSCQGHKWGHLCYKLMKCQSLSQYQMSTFLHADSFVVNRAKLVKAKRHCLMQDPPNPIPPTTPPHLLPYHQHIQLAQLPLSLLTLITILMPRLTDMYIIKKFRKLSGIEAVRCCHALLLHFREELLNG